MLRFMKMKTRCGLDVEGCAILALFNIRPCIYKITEGGKVFIHLVMNFISRKNLLLMYNIDPS